MIASYLHNFIFIKTRKTAGTTVEMVLAPICGPDDIITPLGPREERVRGNGEALCRNFAGDPAVDLRVRGGLISRRRRSRRKAKTLLQSGKFYNHMPAAEIRAALPAEFWERAFKFTVERHPYERVVSRAYFRYEEERHGPFADYLDAQIQHGAYSHFDLYAIDGTVVVDRILRQENLHEDLKGVGERLGIPIPDVLPQGKSTTRRDRRPAREILSEAQKAMIREVCKREFELMGYET